MTGTRRSTNRLRNRPSLPASVRTIPTARTSSMGWRTKRPSPAFVLKCWPRCRCRAASLARSTARRAPRSTNAGTSVTCGSPAQPIAGKTTGAMSSIPSNCGLGVRDWGLVFLRAVGTQSDRKRLAHRTCHPKPFGYAQDKLLDGSQTARPVLSVAEGFFASLRMTVMSGRRTQCPKVLGFDLVGAHFGLNEDRGHQVALSLCQIRLFSCAKLARGRLTPQAPTKG